MARHRRTGLSAVALALAAAGVFALAAPASAHVTVNPTQATQGSFGRFAFRVPTESDSASTTKLEVALPDNPPVGSVSTMPVPGWSVTVSKRRLDPPVQANGGQISEAVSRITWTASDDAAIKPGQFQEFPISLGPLPPVDRMVFKALQTYSDGTVVRWIEEPRAGGPEPEKPAPVLTLVPAAGPSGSPAAGSPAGTGAPAAGSPAGSGAPTNGSAAPVADERDDGGSAALALGIAGLVAGLAGLLLGGLAFTRTRRGSAPPAA